MGTASTNRSYLFCLDLVPSHFSKMAANGRGMNDGAPGALLPSLEAYYSINYAIVSLIFLSNACGFICASFLSNKVHIMLGRCKSLVVGNFLMVLCYVILSAHPPFGAVIVAFFLVGMGMGFMLAHCNSYMVHPTKYLTN